MSPWSTALLVAIRRLSIGLSDLPDLSELVDSGLTDSGLTDSGLPVITEVTGLPESGLTAITEASGLAEASGLTQATGLQDSGLANVLALTGVADSGLTEVTGLQDSGQTAVTEVSTEKKAADLVCFLISVGAARTYELKGDQALLNALCSI